MSPLAMVKALFLVAFVVVLEAGFVLHASVPPSAILEAAAYRQAALSSADAPASDVRLAQAGR